MRMARPGVARLPASVFCLTSTTHTENSWYVIINVRNLLATLLILSAVGCGGDGGNCSCQGDGCVSCPGVPTALPTPTFTLSPSTPISTVTLSPMSTTPTVTRTSMSGTQTPRPTATQGAISTSTATS